MASVITHFSQYVMNAYGLKPTQDTSNNLKFFSFFGLSPVTLCNFLRPSETNRYSCLSLCFSPPSMHLIYRSYAFCLIESSGSPITLLVSGVGDYKKPISVRLSVRDQQAFEQRMQFICHLNKTAIEAQG